MLEKIIKSLGLEHYYYNSNLYSIVLRSDFESSSITFFTEDTFSQQLGYLPHKKGSIIKPHVHCLNKREVQFTNEVLLIKKGSVKLNFYNREKEFIGTVSLKSGDVVLLCDGGHGFEIQEDTVMIEIKQGPYTGIDDKERFIGVESDTGK